METIISKTTLGLASILHGIVSNLAPIQHLHFENTLYSSYYNITIVVALYSKKSTILTAALS